MLAEIEKIGTLSWTESLSYRMLLIPGTRRALQRHQKEFAWMNERPDWGRGRIDPLNPFKYRQLRQPIDQTIGHSDMTSLWGLGLRDGRAFHWDGLNPSLKEVLIGSAIGNGASAKSVDLESLDRIGQWLRDLKAPAYPFPIDRTLAERGAKVFATECAACHAPEGARMGQVIPIAEVGTDRHRLDTWTASSATAFNEFAAGKPWQFKSYRKTNGYVAMPLDGRVAQRAVSAQRVRAHADRSARAGRAPAATLLSRLRRLRSGPRRLLSPRAPTRSAKERCSIRLSGAARTAVIAYGTTLAPDVKSALIEYLKTL